MNLSCAHLANPCPWCKAVSAKKGFLSFAQRPLCSPRPVFLQLCPCRWGPFFHFTQRASMALLTKANLVPEILHTSSGWYGALSFLWLNRHTFWHHLFNRKTWLRVSYGPGTMLRTQRINIQTYSATFRNWNLKQQGDTMILLLEWPKSETRTTLNVGEDVKRQELSLTTRRNAKWYCHSGRHFIPIKQNVLLLHDLTTVLLVIHPKELKCYVHTKPACGCL